MKTRGEWAEARHEEGPGGGGEAAGATAACFGRHTAWHSKGLGEGDEAVGATTVAMAATLAGIARGWVRGRAQRWATPAQLWALLVPCPWCSAGRPACRARAGRIRTAASTATRMIWALAAASRLRGGGCSAGRCGDGH